MDRKLKHDINSLFFKMKTSIHLLTEDVSKEEKETISKILLSMTDKLELLCLTFFADIKNENKQTVNLCEYFGINNHMYINADKKLVDFYIKILKHLIEDGLESIKFEDNSLNFYGNFKIQNEIDKYLVKFLQTLSKKIDLQLDMNKNKVSMTCTGK